MQDIEKICIHYPLTYDHIFSKQNQSCQGRTYQFGINSEPIKLSFLHLLQYQFLWNKRNATVEQANNSPLDKDDKLKIHLSAAIGSYFLDVRWMSFQ